ncbi:MAG: toprim domain-containing protein, partial [Calditrichaeota bacterium]|nr:toprim domain-containing protein [Calditrichota bacterium]
FFAREAIRESGEALFVEGYMDVIQLHQSGIRNVVATSGTALTGEHARLIRRYAPRVLMCYDADSAGIKAAVRGGEVLFQHGLEVKVLILPPGEDPDSYVKANGKAAFLTLLKEAGDYLGFRLNLLKDQYDLASAGGRSQAVAALVETLAEVQDNIRLNFYIEKAAQSLQLPPTLLHNQVRERQKQARSRGYFEDNPPPPEEESPDTEAAPRRAAPLVFTGAWGGEKDVILLLISYFDHIYDYVQAHLQEEDFLNPEFRALFQLLLRQEKGAGKDLLHVVLDHLESEPLRDLLLREIEQTNSQFSKPALYLQGCIKEIKIARYKAKLDLLKRQIKELAPGDPQLLPLLQEMKTAGEAVKKWQDVVCSDEE